MANELNNIADAAKAKINEGADRLREAGHEVAASVSDNPAKHEAEAAKDRGRAEAHNDQADVHAQQVRDGK